MEWGDVATWAGVVAALLAAGVAIRAERRAEKAATEAAADAVRALTAAEESANAQRRLADLAEAEANRYVPPWSLRHRNRDTYEAVNAGTERVYDVTISGPSVLDGPHHRDSLDVHSSVVFFGIHAAMGEGLDEEVKVTWRRTPSGDAEVHQWKNALPPKG